MPTTETLPEVTAEPYDPTLDDDILGELPPTSIEDIDLSVEDIVERAARTDDHLRRWRQESVDRRARWEDEEAVRIEDDARRKGSFAIGATLGLMTAVALTLGGLVVLDPVGASAEAVRVTPEAAPVEVAPVEVAPVEVAPVEVAPVEVAPVEVAPVEPSGSERPAEGPVEAAPAAAEVDAPADAAPAPVDETPPVAASQANGPGLTEARTWQASGFAWATADVADGDVELAWFDARGEEVLDRMACNVRLGDGFRCKAGRSAGRIEHALAQGASPGTWTVSACRGAACSPVGQLTTPL